MRNYEQKVEINWFIFAIFFSVVFFFFVSMLLLLVDVCVPLFSYIFDCVHFIGSWSRSCLEMHAHIQPYIQIYNEWLSVPRLNFAISLVALLLFLLLSCLENLLHSHKPYWLTDRDTDSKREKKGKRKRVRLRAHVEKRFRLRSEQKYDGP